MTSDKSRPANNDHCFEGVGRPYWHGLATGMGVAGIRQGRDGSYLEYVLESDGFATQNGGISNPRIEPLGRRQYYRFFSLTDHNKYGGTSCMAGNWWISQNHFQIIKTHALQNDIPLNKAAQAVLVIPWHDCGYVGCATLTTPVKAYVGRGKLATGGSSPHNAQRDQATEPLQGPVASAEVNQLFIPGDRKLLGRLFNVHQVVRCIKKGEGL